MPSNSNPSIAAKKSLPQAAQVWVNKAIPKSKTQDMKKSFKIGKVNEAPGIYWIEIQNTAPEFPAYEFGSGLHRTKGNPAKYRIAPNRATALAFHWKPEFVPYGSPKFIAISTRSGKYMFRYVDHPGVKPEPAMMPALRDAAPEMLRIIGQTFSVEVIYKGIRESFTVGGK